VIDDLRAMAEAAAAAGNAIGVESAYRSYDDQAATFNHWVATSGYAAALTFSARPGHSEHQLGLAIDFRSDPGGSPFTGSWGQTPAGKWMRLHAWEFGFIRSYPPNDKAVTCYASEAWHYRYVGRDMAAAIHASGLTTRQYLWANFTTAVIPAVTPKPSKGSGGTAPPSAGPTAEPSGATAEPSAEPSPVVEPSAPARPTAGRTSGAAGAPGQPQPPPSDVSPVADLDPAVGAGLIVALVGVLAVTVLVLRRGRSGVGL
jgi:D-alanyl-D-alanine carboxypeptidase